MSEPITDRYQLIPSEKPRTREPMVVHLPSVDGEVRAELDAWLALNGVERPLEQRGVVIGVETVTFWRSGFDPLGPRDPAGVRFEGSVAYAKVVCYDLRIGRQPGPALLPALADAGVLRCAATATVLDLDLSEGGKATPLECRVQVDATGRHAGPHQEDQDTSRGTLPGQLTWRWDNLHKRPVLSPTLEGEAHEFHASGMLRALAAVDRALGAVSWHSRGGVPVLVREEVLAVVNQVARECLGDGWAADLRAACDALRVEDGA